MAREVDVVTGAFSYTGRYIAAKLVAEGRRVRSLTRRAPRDPVDGLEVVPYTWRHPDLVRVFRGADTFYNTYWIRVSRGGASFDRAVANSRLLFEAAREAGIRRIVHVSITKADQASYLPYFSGKAKVEEHLRQSGVPHGIVRPSVVFGGEDVFVNNIAWLLRRFPLFLIAGKGDYRLRLVHVEDVARICVEQGRVATNTIVDAVGPDDLTFGEMVRTIRDAIGTKSAIVPAPRWAVVGVAKVLGLALRDELLSPGELRGLMDGLVTADGPPTGDISFRAWVTDHAPGLGRSYVSEVKRNYRRRATR